MMQDATLETTASHPRPGMAGLRPRYIAALRGRGQHVSCGQQRRRGFGERPADFTQTSYGT